MSVTAVPIWLVDQVKQRRYIAAAIIVVLLALAVFSKINTTSSLPAIPASQFYTVIPMDLELKVSKDGEIQAINNIDIQCQVEGSTTITQIVKEGTNVKKGDIVAVLDSALITQKLEDATLEFQKSDADLTNAKELLGIQKDKNASDLEAAEVALQLAQLDLRQYVEGVYPQQLANAKTEVDMAVITLKNRQDDFEQSKKLYAKDFLTAADMKKAELDVLTARNALNKAQTAFTVLAEFSHDYDLTSRKNSLSQAEQRQIRQKRQNTSDLAWRSADVTAKEQAMLVIRRRVARLKEQLAATTISAPADGIVIYGSTTDRNQQNPIQEGTQVRERQLVVRLPDTSAMKAVVRIHETIVPKLKVGQEAKVKIVGIDQPVAARIARISPVSDSSNRWWNPDLREYPLDLDLDPTPANLKPGISAQVEILVDRFPGALAVPLDTVYSAGPQKYVFVPDGQHATPVLVEAGVNNDTHVQITKGLLEGQQVLRLQPGQGRDLLEKAGIKVQPATQPSGGRKRKDNGPTVGEKGNANANPRG